MLYAHTGALPMTSRAPSADTMYRPRRYASPTPYMGAMYGPRRMRVAHVGA